MQRFRPTSRPETLSSKVLTTLDEKRFMPPADRKLVLQVAGFHGMDEDARQAMARLLALAETRKVAVAGRFMPDDGVSARLAERGIAENVDEADFFRFRRIVIPYCGISPRQRRDWEEAGHSLEDLTSPQVRRAQVALGLLRMEGAQGLVIGRHEDPESLALAGGGSGTKILEDTTDTSRLVFYPAFGVVSQTTLSPRKVTWLVQQLRFRYRDAKVTFLDTVCPAMAAREEALEKLLVTCDRAVIVGRAGESSCEALMETALRRGKPAVVVTGPDDLNPEDFTENPRVALTAGAFALDETIRSVAEALAGI
jgi:(E)-4-hydroxy-3-methyl-but-2-enyl pyrophosphate reductase